MESGCSLNNKLGGGRIDSGPLVARIRLSRSTATEGGLFLNDEDLARIGFLYLNCGAWEGKQIVSENWVKSGTPHAPMPYTVAESVPPYSVAGQRLYLGIQVVVISAEREICLDSNQGRRPVAHSFSTAKSARSVHRLGSS